MTWDAGSALAQLQTPGPETGVDELVTFWPVLVRAGWFLLGFLAVVLLGRLIVQPFLSRLIRRRNRNNPTLQAALVLYYRLVVVLLAVVVGVVIAGYGGFLTGSAIVISAIALAVGIAAQEVIGSLVSGVALVLDREFNVGDYIQWEGGEGVVKSIALRVTRVETVDGELVTIPNTVLTSHEIIRPYGQGNHRIVQELGVAYDDDISEVLAHLEAVAVMTDGILAEPPPTAYVDELGEQVSIRVSYWVDDPNRREVFATRSAYARAVKDRLESEGITISPDSSWEIQGRITIDEPT
ncbi:mechanosensitive ion channel family protein [Halolamina sp.]|jgi:small-conductance mechanosensitive channel|uniref:mechanosensitive ion channel family protein n=1 Tax=Halolamina sp. TaxID=1940283 RepID=UPI000223B71C|nr:MscS Mechanosensitive ion channel [halophilic archaeon DL31]